MPLKLHALFYTSHLPNIAEIDGSALVFLFDAWNSAQSSITSDGCNCYRILERTVTVLVCLVSNSLLQLPLPFNPGSRAIFVSSRLLALNFSIVKYCAMLRGFRFFSRFPPPPLLPPPVHLPPPILPGFHHLSPATLVVQAKK